MERGHEGGEGSEQKVLMLSDAGGFPFLTGQDGPRDSRDFMR